MAPLQAMDSKKLEQAYNQKIEELKQEKRSNSNNREEAAYYDRIIKRRQQFLENWSRE